MDGGAGSVKTIVGRPGATLPLHAASARSEEHTSELQSQSNLVCRLLLEKKKKNKLSDTTIPLGVEFQDLTTMLRCFRSCISSVHTLVLYLYCTSVQRLCTHQCVARCNIC